MDENNQRNFAPVKYTSDHDEIARLIFQLSEYILSQLNEISRLNFQPSTYTSDHDEKRSADFSAQLFKYD